jgi:S1-C subfamily serine protease
MSYKNIEEFSKMVKNSKSLRHKELRLQTDQAVLILSEITEILAQKFQKTPTFQQTTKKEDLSYDAGGSYSYPIVIEDVTLIGYDAEADIAVLRINKDVPHSILEWETERPYAGQDAWAIGHGAGQIWSITYGIISNTYRPNYSLSTFIHYWQTDAVINSGNSGGPLLDENGHVIGVNTLIISPTKFYVGYGYAVPGLLAKRVAEQIIETGYHVKPSIGIMMGTVEDEEYYADLQEKGVDSILEVKEIIAGTPAEHFGIQSGDIITAVDGTPIFSSPEVIEILWTKMPGDELELEIFRNEEFIKIIVILDQSAPAEPRSFIGR